MCAPEQGPQSLHPEVLLEWPVRTPPDQGDGGNRAQLWTLSLLARPEGGGLRFTEEAVGLGRTKWGKVPTEGQLAGMHWLPCQWLCSTSQGDGNKPNHRGDQAVTAGDLILEPGAQFFTKQLP